MVRIEDDRGETHALPVRSAALGPDLEAVAGQLEREGVRKFIEPYDRLLAVLGRRAVEFAA